jgi:hypothetical protein
VLIGGLTGQLIGAGNPAIEKLPIDRPRPAPAARRIAEVDDVPLKAAAVGPFDERPVALPPASPTLMTRHPMA